MKPAELREALTVLGERWKFKRPLFASELGVTLAMGGADPGVQVRRWLSGAASIPGPVRVAVNAMVRGHKPATMPRPGLMADRAFRHMLARRRKAKQKRRNVARAAQAKLDKAAAKAAGFATVKAWKAAQAEHVAQVQQSIFQQTIIR